ncbi:phage holin family protein [Loktanella sp. D2R18]|uniref:phage holin family protein n=1 Tax=Rhodobacterales TaxID=204455 RepID=UPI000DE807C9|nr:MULTISPECIES: phage holin family protein [Rhodobacterales]MDO6590352.1 phage holin family protein [Yoonia sp. 1_MG-2023]RBW42847.1 phage holin family protein [Loktanella sp. D2R18]
MHKNTLRDTPVLFVDTIRQFTSLVQGELKLARTELKAILSRAAMGLVFLAIAFLMGLVALNVLASAAVAYIAANGMSVALAALIVGGALLLIALVFVLMGKSRLNTEALSPNKTNENIRRDVHAIKEATNA